LTAGIVYVLNSEIRKKSKGKKQQNKIHKGGSRMCRGIKEYSLALYFCSNVLAFPENLQLYLLN
jgi:hypothetical protein